MLVVSWNVNSIRARLDRALALIERSDPEVLCLQETKVEDAQFPRQAFEDRGYVVTTLGQRTYNGVAILSKQTPKRVHAGLDNFEDPAARALGVELSFGWVYSLYIPNGSTPDDSKFAYKQRWLEALVAQAAARSPKTTPCILAGDYNIAPSDALDIKSPEDWRDSVLCHPSVRAAFQQLIAQGYVDSFRHSHPEATTYSWWDYRQLAFPRNEGLRIDHLLCSQPLIPALEDAGIMRDERKGKGASDHAPAWLRLRA